MYLQRVMGKNPKIKAVLENLGNHGYGSPRKPCHLFSSSSTPSIFLLSSLSATTFSPLPLELGQTLVPQFSSFHIKIYQGHLPTFFFPLFQGTIHPSPFPGLTLSWLLVLFPPGPGAVLHLPAPLSFAASASPLPLTVIVLIISGCCHQIP